MLTKHTVSLVLKDAYSGYDTLTPSPFLGRFFHRTPHYLSKFSNLKICSFVFPAPGYKIPKNIRLACCYGLPRLCPLPLSLRLEYSAHDEVLKVGPGGASKRGLGLHFCELTRLAMQLEEQ